MFFAAFWVGLMESLQPRTYFLDIFLARLLLYSNNVSVSLSVFLSTSDSALDFGALQICVCIYLYY